MPRADPVRSTGVRVVSALLAAALVIALLWLRHHTADGAARSVDPAPLPTADLGVDGGVFDTSQGGTESMTERVELEFFNTLTGELKIELNEPARPIAPGMMNLHAPPSAQIVSLRLTLGVPPVDEDSEEEPRALTEAELTSVAFAAPVIRLRGLTDQSVVVHAPDGQRFSVRDLLHAIEQMELATRHTSEWFGGVDVQHTYFEGIEEDGDGVWAVQWGS